MGTGKRTPKIDPRARKKSASFGPFKKKSQQLEIVAMMIARIQNTSVVYFRAKSSISRTDTPSLILSENFLSIVMPSCLYLAIYFNNLQIVLLKKKELELQPLEHQKLIAIMEEKDQNRI